MQPLSEGDISPDPIEQFGRWYTAVQDAGLPEPTAMTLATATRDGHPSARMVLLKRYDRRGFVFYSNYDSRKGGELERNPHAALVFFWPQFHRQIRIEGSVTRLTPAESDSYFASRARGSRIAAAASRQSAVIPDRAALEQQVVNLENQYTGEDVPRPEWWGGYRLTPSTIEFWQGRPNRLHDRLRYTRGPDGGWVVERLAP